MTARQTAYVTDTLKIDLASHSKSDFNVRHNLLLIFIAKIIRLCDPSDLCQAKRFDASHLNPFAPNRTSKHGQGSTPNSTVP